MKLSKHRRLQGNRHTDQQPSWTRGGPSSHEIRSLPGLVAGIFGKLHVAQRVRLLRRLLRSVGPMALAVLGGGAFAKFVAQARRPRMSVSREDAARVTSKQVFELVRYVEQSNPQVLQRMLLVLSRDAALMAAVGASIATVMRHLLSREASRPQLA